MRFLMLEHIVGIEGLAQSLADYPRQRRLPLVARRQHPTPQPAG
jgi:hypothetical protein